MHTINKYGRAPAFLSVVFLSGIVYVFSLIMDVLLTSRMGVESSLAKCATTLILLVLAAFLTRYMRMSPNVMSAFAYSKSHVVIALVFFFILIMVLQISASVSSLSGAKIDVVRLCASSKHTFYQIVRTGFFSPALETILFVFLLPSLFIHRYPERHPIWGIIFVSFLFAMLHLPNSLELFSSKFFSGIIFCYMYFGLKSLTGAFILHSIVNITLIVLDQFGSSFCMAVHQTSSTLMPLIYILALILSFSLLWPLAKESRKTILHLQAVRRTL
jgi:membrane protease YdiL (CAAX protease family)